MRIILLTALSLSLMLSLDSCSRKSLPNRPNVSDTPEDLESSGIDSNINVSQVLLIEIQRSGGLGSCPRYLAKVFDNGQIIFFGFQHVAYIGDHSGLLTTKELTKELAQLEKWISELGYSSLSDSYPDQREDFINDLSTCDLRFYEMGKPVKTVTHNNGGPRVLYKFQDYVEGMLLNVHMEPIKR